MPFRDPPELPEELRPKPGPVQSRPAAGLTMDQLSRVSAIGSNLAFTAGAGALLGWLLDRWLGTAPWCLLGLALVGLVVGFRRFFIETRLLMAQQNRAAAGRRSPDGLGSEDDAPVGSPGAGDGQAGDRPE